MNVPDWQLPDGVDRGLWDYMHSEAMIANYDAQMGESPLARVDVEFCNRHFTASGRLVDLGTGTGRLCRHFAVRGFECVGVDLSAAMLAEAQRLDTTGRISWQHANIVEYTSDIPFDYAACLFSTLGMVRGVRERLRVLNAVRGLLRPGGRFVVHAHHRGYSRLGWRRFITADHRREQAYGGAPLTLHHFRESELQSLLEAAGFTILETLAIDDQGRPVRSDPYGWLMAAQAGSSTSQ
jgi:SAM-dependent methyltransferase